MKFLIVLTATVFNFAFSAPKPLVSIPAKGKTTFEAVGKPAMIKIKGESPSAAALISFTDSNTSLSAILNLELLKTGIDMRDDHMKEKYLETKKFPEAKLVIATLKIPSTWSASPAPIKDQDFDGILTLHGKDVPVKGVFSLNDKKIAQAEFKIKLTDFNIEIPEYLGVKVAEVVTIKTEIQFE